ncbi:hypothetical protein AMECASPLE_015136 [Ameca splendens]|uniref:EGF-like domain-containing protein n=1 Tax=Ameca splendens TaxID=208324 RepID=A0ABV0YPL2_9TELE
MQKADCYEVNKQQTRQLNSRSSRKDIQERRGEILEQFFTDPCASSPCLHGNCSRSEGGEEGEPAYSCECTEGYEGERCDQILLDLPPAADWGPATPSAPELATLVTSTTMATAPHQQPTTVPVATTLAPPTLQPWQPKPGQRLLVVQWDADRVTEGLHCVSPELCELTSGTLTLSLEVPEETAVKVLVNASGAPVLWRVSEEGFLHSSILNGTTFWFLQAPDGLVVPDSLLPLGQNYFLSVIRVGAPTAPEVTLRLNLTVKASSCVEPGSSFSDPQCSGKGKCITQPSESTFFCECEDGYTGIFCEELDACHHRPCRNNGTCSDVRQGGEGQNFTCTCQPGMFGHTDAFHMCLVCLFSGVFSKYDSVDGADANLFLGFQKMSDEIREDGQLFVLTVIYCRWVLCGRLQNNAF